MLQRLLAERFGLKVHHETKNLPVYEIRIGKNGSKLKPSGTGTPPDDRDGFPKLPPGVPAMTMTNRPDRNQLAAQQQPVFALAGMLRSSAGRFLIDKTGLTGTYDFTLIFNPRPEVTESLGPDLFTALEEQLGLRLVDAKAPFDLIVVDQAEKVPTEN